MYRNMLASVSCDWETVKNVVTGNSSSKPDRTGRDGKFVKQSKMLNNSAYSRLGNNTVCAGVAGVGLKARRQVISRCCSYIPNVKYGCLRVSGHNFLHVLNKNQRANGPVNAHLISWPSKAQNKQNLENIW